MKRYYFCSSLKALRRLAAEILPVVEYGRSRRLGLAAAVLAVACSNRVDERRVTDAARELARLARADFSLEYERDGVELAMAIEAVADWRLFDEDAEKASRRLIKAAFTFVPEDNFRDLVEILERLAEHVDRTAAEEEDRGEEE